MIETAGCRLKKIKVSWSPELKIVLSDLISPFLGDYSVKLLVFTSLM